MVIISTKINYEKVHELYEAGLNTVEIAEELGCNNTTVGRILNKEFGITPSLNPRKLYKIKPDKWPEILDQYYQGKTTEELGEEYGVTDHIISKIIKKQGGKVRPAKRRSPICNHDYFHCIDSPEKAYFLGWLTADGGIVKRKDRDEQYAIRIQLVESDRKILDLFAKELGADNGKIVKKIVAKGSMYVTKSGETKFSPDSNHVYMSFTSREMAYDLAKYGVVPNKTWITSMPNIRDDLKPHFLRGYFEGNGTVTNTKGNLLRVGFYGSEKICNDINDYLFQSLKIQKHSVSKSSCYHVWIGKQEDVKNLYEYMYQDCGDFYLDRKKQKFDDHFS